MRAVRLIPFALLALLAMLATMSGSCAEAKKNKNPATYKYVDDDGKAVFVDDMAKVPNKYADAAVQVSGGSLAQIYKYTTKNGTVAYTNDRHRIPEDRRDSAERVDLSHISLNHELAEDLTRAIDLQYAAVLASPDCENAREEADANWFVQAWRKQPALILFGALIIALLALTPFMVRRMFGQVWVRVLTVAIPMLLFVGMFTYAAFEMKDIREQLTKKADPCRPDGQGPSFGKLDLVRNRVNQIDRALAKYGE